MSIANISCSLFTATRGEEMHKQIKSVPNWRLLVANHNPKPMDDNQIWLFMHFFVMSCNEWLEWTSLFMVLKIMHVTLWFLMLVLKPYERGISMLKFTANYIFTFMKIGGGPNPMSKTHSLKNRDPFWYAPIYTQVTQFEPFYTYFHK